MANWSAGRAPADELVMVMNGFDTNFDPAVGMFNSLGLAAADVTGAQALYVGKRDDLSAGETPTDSYWELQAQAAWRPLANNRKFELALVGRNLSDEVQRNAIALNKDLVVMPGRDIRFVVRDAF